MLFYKVLLDQCFWAFWKFSPAIPNYDIYLFSDVLKFFTAITHSYVFGVCETCVYKKLGYICFNVKLQLFGCFIVLKGNFVYRMLTSSDLPNQKNRILFWNLASAESEFEYFNNLNPKCISWL